MKNISKFVAMLMSIVMVAALFVGCAGDTTSTTTDDAQATAQVDTQSGDNSQIETDYTSDDRKVSDSTELTYLFSGEVTDWNYLTTTNNTPAMYIDSLVEYDYLGLCQPCLAESWTRSDDGLVWTFKIRQGVKWMTYDKQEYAELTAHDFVTSCEYILNPDNASMMADMMYCLKGAEEYHQAAVNGLECDFNNVGVKALDDYTLEYTLENPIPYFLSTLTYKNFFPANKQWIEECGENFSTDNETMLYCGEYIMTTYEPSSLIVAELNPTYWDMEDMHITKITKIYNSEAGTVEPEMYLRGEISGCDVPTEQLEDWLNDPEKYEKIRPCRPSFWTYFYYFCFWPNFDEKYEPENWKLAVNNLNFRKSILHAFDKISLIEISDPYNAEAHVQNTMTCRDFLNSSGKDYVDLDPIAEFAASDTYDVELANEYKEKAIEELTAAGAHFPVIVYMPYVTGDNSSTLRVQLIEQFLERNLGTDYVDVQVEGYAEDGYVENVLRCGNYSLLFNSWYPDYSDPLTMTSPFTVSGADRRNWIFMADGMAEVSDTYVDGSYQAKDGKYYYNIVYDQMVNAADEECVDLEKRYELFAEAENWLVNEQCMVIPFMRGGTGYMGSTLMPFESQYAPFGASDGRYKYQYIYTDGINTDEYYAAYEEWEAERSAKMAELAAEGKVQGVDY